MVNLPHALPPGLITAVYTTLLIRRVVFASTALFIYDWLVLLPVEIEEIWCRKISIVTILFVGTRYGTLINWIVTVVDLTIAGDEFSCNALQQFLNATVILVTISLYGIFLLRTWSIYGRNIFILALLLSFGLSSFGVIVAISFWGQPGGFSEGSLPILSGCNKASRPWLIKWNLINISLALVFSTAVVILTVIRTLSALVSAKAAHVRSTLYAMLLRDGIIYYLAAAILNIANLVVSQTTSSSDELNVIVSRTKFALTPIIACRLILNLRHLNHEEISTRGYSTIYHDTLPQMEFAVDNFLGNIGAPVRDFDEESIFEMEDVGREESDGGLRITLNLEPESEDYDRDLVHTA